MENNIRVERAKKRITQAELGKEVGVTRVAINNVENKKYVPSTPLAIKIAKYFGKNVEDIFNLEDGD